jgi:[acyl-carrier-protein] S-malonyltransferase
MIVFTYPGQGSQAPGMGAAWADHPSWELVDEASDAADRDVAALLLDTNADELTMTRNAQSYLSWMLKVTQNRRKHL